MGLLLDILYLTAAVVMFPFYYLRLRRTGRGLGQIAVRLKAPPRMDSTRYRVWIHAVSVGEVLAAVPLVDALYNLLPSDVEIVLSVSTTSGMEMARQKAPHIAAFYCPPDLSFLMARAFRRIEPSMLVLMELELWPNMLREAAKRKVPVVVVNGRVSERSEKGYRKLGWFFRRMTSKVSMFGVQNHRYAKRLLGLGVPEERVAVLGNVKYDMVLRPVAEEKVEHLRRLMGFDKDTPVLVAGSTHPGEEKVVVEAYKRLRAKFSGLRLVIVPRHPGRAKEVAALLGELPHVFRSELEKGSAETDGKSPTCQRLPAARDGAVIVGDVMGELALTYHLATVVFVGGSLIEHGGQNPLEPAAAAKPMVTGPHMFNFAAEMELLKEAGAAVEATNAQTLYEAVEKLLSDPAGAAAKGLAGYEAISRHKGASGRYAEVVRKFLAETMTGG